MNWYKIYNGKRIHAGEVDDKWILHTLCGRSYLSSGRCSNPPDDNVMYYKYTTPGYGQIMTSKPIEYVYCHKCLSKYRSVGGNNGSKG